MKFRLALASTVSLVLCQACVARLANTVCRQQQETPQGASPIATATPSHDPRILFAKGEASLQSGDLAAAEAAFRGVLAVDPKAGGAYANLAVIAMRRKDWDHALNLLQKA